MRNRIALATGFALIAAGTAFATNARVMAMGKNDTYFMDDVSVWSNPANANLYPNYLLGELGTMTTRDTSGNNYLAFARYNRDPEGPWFGAIFAKSFSADAAAGNRYPQVVIGGAFNRSDDWDAYFPKKIQSRSAGNNSTYNTPLTMKFDGLLGGALSNGTMVGVKTRLAFGDSSSGPVSATSVISANTIGVNAPIGEGVDLEVTGTVAFLDASIDSGTYKYGGQFDPSFGASARAFISAPQIFGVVVPAVSFRSISAPWLEKTEFRIGSGANVSLDRGFFWLGVDYFLFDGEQRPMTTTGTILAYDTNEMSTQNGVRISFGIERNIWTDWFVIRVGGQKIFANEDWTKGKASRMNVITNPDGGDEAKDLVSFGFGLNIEDKLKVDAVVAKDVLFTGGALLSGPTDHILSRISASYSF